MNQVASVRLTSASNAGGDVTVFEQLTALSDSALDIETAEALIDRLLESQELRAAWDEHHFIGDCLRSDEMAAFCPNENFATCFSARLAAEPTILAPRRRTVARRRWLRYGLPGVSAAAAIVMVGWMAMPAVERGDVAVATTGGNMPQAVKVSAPSAVDTRRLNEYLAAHRQFSGSAVHGPGYVQSASFNVIQNDH